MDKKWIWLVLFGAIAVVGGIMYWSGPSTPDTDTPTAETSQDSTLSDPDAPALGIGKEQIRPTVPGARPDGNQMPEALSPNSQTAPPPGFHSAPDPVQQKFDSFDSNQNPSPSPNSLPPGGGRVDQEELPPSAFEPVPPQAFENPDFVTPPPPPPQFDTEPPPFEEEPIPQPGIDPNMPPQDDPGDYPQEVEGY